MEANIVNGITRFVPVCLCVEWERVNRTFKWSKPSPNNGDERTNEIAIEKQLRTSNSVEQKYKKNTIYCCDRKACHLNYPHVLLDEEEDHDRRPKQRCRVERTTFDEEFDVNGNTLVLF